MTAARVMIVEDDEFAAAEIAQRVERLGYEVSVVRSVADAAVIPVERSPDIILLGVVSRAEQRAVDAARSLRDSHRVPIIYLVGPADVPRLDDIGLPPPLAFVVKPGHIDALRSNVELGLRLHQTEQTLRLARNRLHQASSNLRTIEDLAGLGSWAQDLMTGEIEISPASLAIHGVDREFVGATLATLWSHVQQNDRERLETLAQRAREKCQPFTVEYRVLPPGAGERLVRVRVAAQCDGTVRPMRLVAVVQDVTAQTHSEEALRESEARASRLLQERDFILENSRDVLYYIDANAVLYYISPVVEELTGIPVEEWQGDFRKHLVDSEATRRAVSETFDILTTGHEYPPTMLEFRKKDGGILYGEVSERAVVRDGRVQGIVGVARDVSERLQVEARLRQAAVVFENTLEAIMITDPLRNITAVNRAFAEITGYTEAEVTGVTADVLASGDESSNFREQCWNAVTTRGRWSGEMWNRRKSGEIFPAWIAASAIRDSSDRLTNYVVVMSDLSHLHEPEERLDRLAHYDPLTSLPNRLLFRARLAHALRRAERERRNIGVMFADLDGFKKINDTRGHPVGDRLLQEVADRLSKCVRKEDTVARLSGDEFVLILENVSGAHLLSDVARKLLDSLSRPYRVDGEDVALTASIGISTFPRDGRDEAELVRLADVAMYRAKETGGGTFQFYAQTS